MKLTTTFAILGDALKNKPLDNMVCTIDDIEVPIKECGLELEVNKQEPNLDFWDEECEEHPTNSHCKVYDD
jgi:hypothetical protein